MTNDTLKLTTPGEDESRNRRQMPARPARFTTTWGWLTVPRFGSAGSGGLEYEPLPERKSAA